MNDSELLYFIQKNFEETIGQPLYKYQQNLCKLQGNVIINKSRQTGITTALACIALWKALLQKKTVLICSPSERQSHHVLEIIKRFLNNKKNAVEIPIVAENQSTIQFNQGKILSLPNSPETIRGETADIVIMDEFAHFLNATDDKIMEALTPTLSRGGQLWLISTPYGERGKHWEIWIGYDWMIAPRGLTDKPAVMGFLMRTVGPGSISVAEEIEHWGASPD